MSKSQINSALGLKIIPGIPSTPDEQLLLLEWLNVNRGWHIEMPPKFELPADRVLEPGEFPCLVIHNYGKGKNNSMQNTFIEHISAIDEVLEITTKYRIACWKKLKHEAKDLKLVSSANFEPGAYWVIMDHKAFSDSQMGYKVIDLQTRLKDQSEKPANVFLGASEVLSMLLFNPGLLMGMGQIDKKGEILSGMALPGYIFGRGQVLCFGFRGGNKISLTAHSIFKRWQMSSPIVEYLTGY
jgi:hypothetical protein